MKKTLKIFAIIALTATGLAAQETDGFIERGSLMLPLPDLRLKPATTELELPPLAAYKNASFFDTERRLTEVEWTPRFSFNPYAYDLSATGAIYAWDTGLLFGANSRATLPGLLTQQSGEVGVTQTFGNLSLTAGFTADRYQFQRGSDMLTSYGINGKLAYRFSDLLTLNVFGDYRSNARYHSPAALPYMGASSYGATLDLRLSDRFGLEAGAQSVYDPFSKSWMTVPIVQPYVRLNNGGKIGFDAGWFIGTLIDNAFNGGNYYNRHNPTIAPPTLPPMPVR